jgi:uncharacterized lipoprotein YddW (UPF0748 family)
MVNRFHSGWAWYVVALMLCATCNTWAETRALKVFDEPSASWLSDRGKSTPPRRLTQGHRGLRLDCKFSGGKERQTWNLTAPVATAGQSFYSLWVRVDNPEAVRRISLYFRSGQGWFAGWIPPGDGTWRRITLGRRDFETEGTPSGWDQIDGMRISIWRGSGKRARVELAEMSAETRDVVLIRNSLQIFNGRSDAWAVKRHTRLIYRWLEEAGLPIGQLDDTDLRAGLPKACKVALLPYNPTIDAAQARALAAFCDRGGRIIAMQSGAPELLKLLGIQRVTLTKTGPTRAFSAIQPLPWVRGGLPPHIPQDNVSVLLPTVRDAVVIARWKNGAGVLTDSPAITLHPNGAFLGGWLTAAGRQEKTRLLLALIGKLCPSHAPVLARNLLDESQLLLGTSSWDATRAMIETAATETGSTQDISTYIRHVENYRNQANAAVESESFPALAQRAEVLRGMVRRTYGAAVGPAADEMRAVWCHHAHGVDGLSWDEVASRVKRAGLDTIVPNMAWAGRAYYPSSVLPQINQKDQLADCLAAAQQHALKLHVWLVCFNLEGAEPAYLERMRREGRLQRSAAGGEKQWLCPSDPRNRKHHTAIVTELATNYAIDGVMLDYIRYPNSDNCYCQGCHKRFVQQTGTGKLTWPADVRGGKHQGRYQTWRREQITTLVSELRSALKRVRPRASLSAAVYRSWPSCRLSMGQDWINWLRSGAIDFACPMNYEQDHALFETQLISQLKAAGPGKRIYPGIGVSHPGLPPEGTVHQVRLARRAGAKGFILFDLERDLLDQHLPLLRDGATSAPAKETP